MKMDISSLCRGCMKDVTSEDNHFDQNTVKMFTFCTNIGVSEDQLPRQFCSQCTSSIQSCFTFISTARDVDLKLKHIVGSSQSLVKPEIPEDHFLHDCGIKSEGLEIEIYPIKGELSRCNNGDSKSEQTKLERPNAKQLEKDTIIYRCPVCKTHHLTKEAYDKHRTKHKNFYHDGLYIVEESISKYEGWSNPDYKGQDETKLEEPSEDPIATLSNAAPETKKAFKCLECKRHFFSKKKYDDHMATHTAVSPEVYMAEESVDKSTDDWSVADTDWSIADYKMKETITENSTDDATNPATSPAPGKDTKVYKCPLCTSHFAKKTKYEQHIVSEHTVDTEEKKYNAEENVFEMSESEESLCPEPEALDYHCPHCPKSFTTAKKLQRHRRVKHKGTPFHCTECNERFRQRRKYEAHLRKHERDKQDTGILGLTCQECHKVFKSKCFLVRHLEVHKYTLRPYLCDICGSQYSGRQAMLDHQLIHTGVKPFTCDVCGYTSRQSSNMQRHKRAHLNERKHQCVECGKGFNEQSTLKKHMLWHLGKNQYKCPHCENMYRSPGNRRKHIIRAHGLEPSEIPRLAKDGGPARRYVTEETSVPPPYTLVSDRTKQELP